MAASAMVDTQAMVLVDTEAGLDMADVMVTDTTVRNGLHLLIFLNWDESILWSVFFIFIFCACSTEMSIRKVKNI